MQRFRGGRSLGAHGETRRGATGACREHSGSSGNLTDSARAEILPFTSITFPSNLGFLGSLTLELPRA